MRGCPKGLLSLPGGRREDVFVLEDSVETGLRELIEARAALAASEAALVVRARSHGATWAELGDALGLSKQAARKRHLAIDPIFARRPQRPPTIAEYHAEMIAVLRAQERSSP